MSRFLQAAGELFRPRSPLYRILGATSSFESSTKSLSTVACPSTPTQENPVRSFYRRELPVDLISFTSTEGRLLFKDALEAGTIENYFNLVGNFTSQSEPAYCGLGSLAMVLNAMEVDPGRTWKGVWRWYSDEMLECCSPLDLVKEKGLTFDQFICLAKCHGLDVTSYRHDQSSLGQFKDNLQRTSTEPGLYMVVAFSRQSLGQTGTGHFSPIGAYHTNREFCLVLDVARFKYPSYWAPIDRIWKAMEQIDPDTGHPRGYVMLKLANPRITGCP